MMTTLFDTAKQLLHRDKALYVTVSTGFSDFTIRTIKVRSEIAGIYEIVSENITTMEYYQQFFAAENFVLAVNTWDNEVKNLDHWSLFGSDHLRWNDVEIKVRKKLFIAPSIGRLKEALSHLTFGAEDCYGE